MQEHLVQTQLTNTKATPHLAWAEGATLSIPNALAKQLNVEVGSSIDSASIYPIDAMWSEQIRDFATWIEKAPTSSKLPFSYQKIPSSVRSIIAKIIGRYQRQRTHVWAKFPTWPLDLSADILADLAKPAHRQKETYVVLSHDLDSLEGLENAVNYFLPLEEAVGARSTNYVVPALWKLPHNLLHNLVERGHELGVHGYNHANTTPFSNQEECYDRLYQAKQILKDYPIRGYRAPSLIRTPMLLQGLSKLFEYDSSIPTSGGLFPKPNNGCASARPFYSQNIAVLPLSMPRDGSLLFLGHNAQQIVEIWKKCAKMIINSGGIVVLLTHCEKRFSGNPAMLKAYEQILLWFSKQQKCRFVTAYDAINLYIGTQNGI